MVIAGLPKNKNTILLLQIIELGLSVIAYFLLGGYVGAIISLISIYRNNLVFHNKLNIKYKSSIITLTLLITTIFNNQNIIGYLPIISNIIYICFINTQDIIKFKFLIIIQMIMWTIYDYLTKAYIESIFDTFYIMTNLISIIIIYHKNCKEYVKIII